LDDFQVKGPSFGPEARVLPLKNNPNLLGKLGLFSRGGPLPLGTSFGNHPKRKPPRGGVSFDQLARNSEERLATGWLRLGGSLKL